MAIYGPHGSETKAPNKVDGKISDNQKTAVPKKPTKTKLSQSGKPVGDQQSKKGRGRPRLLIMEPVILDVFRNLFLHWLGLVQRASVRERTREGTQS